MLIKVVIISNVHRLPSAEPLLRTTSILALLPIPTLGIHIQSDTTMAVPSSTYSLSHAVSTFDPAFRQLGRTTTSTSTSTGSFIDQGKRYDYDHDILIYGATSFTGKLVVKYLLQHPQYKSSDFSFALGGRTKSKLDDLAEQVEAEGHQRPAVVCFPLSSSEGSEGEEIEEGVRKAVERCKVVVNLAGPFSTQNAEVLIRCVSVLCVWLLLLLLPPLLLLLPPLPLLLLLLRSLFVVFPPRFRV
jgi:hypothetical protein